MFDDLLSNLPNDAQYMKAQTHTPPILSENLIKFCCNCGSNKFHEKIEAYEEHHVSEKIVLCDNCETTINYWFYGFYHNEKTPEYKKMLRQKKIERILK